MTKYFRTTSSSLVKILGGRPTITAEHPLIMPTDHLHGLSVAVPMLKKSYKYAEVVNGVVQKDVELEINRRRLRQRRGLSEDINTDRPSTIAFMSFLWKILMTLRHGVVIQFRIGILTISYIFRQDLI